MATRQWDEIEVEPTEKRPDIRLVVADMDGTLLDANSQIPDSFWPMLSKLEERGIAFVPASGRQFQTLEDMFGTDSADGKDRSDSISLIAENGNVVCYRGDIIGVNGMDFDFARQIIDTVDAATAPTANPRYNIGLVVCGLQSAYVQRDDEPFLQECRKYYHALRIVDDLHEVLEDESETILKLAIFDFDAAEPMAKALFSNLPEKYCIQVSAKHWADIMRADTDKRTGVESIQEHMHITPDQTAVFGDFLNDAGMLSDATWSFAMENAHDKVKEIANFIAPANTEEGVMQVVNRLVA
ncbi:haloacid dehalogenase [Bifidobacterium dolichotidis]|uniref:Haloacid dehalogenase n=1 Tax=Bifidobacterium dolichotidis TaxID=2306976 RepID=A0A430FPU3_9BIFI|nr:HAD family hydrolase [Bifidobacterium dolichotidis]RSX54862.1 haloacid dehalogenase [Bifidobacterium dolichotidis]